MVDVISPLYDNHNTKSRKSAESLAPFMTRSRSPQVVVISARNSKGHAAHGCAQDRLVTRSLTWSLSTAHLQVRAKKCLLHKLHVYISLFPSSSIKKRELVKLSPGSRHTAEAMQGSDLPFPELLPRYRVGTHWEESAPREGGVCIAGLCHAHVPWSCMFPVWLRVWRWESLFPWSYWFYVISDIPI